MPVNDLPRHTHNGRDSSKVNFDDLSNTPSVLTSLANANPPLGSISSPGGGDVIDTQARTAINTIISRLEDLGFIEE